MDSLGEALRSADAAMPRPAVRALTPGQLHGWAHRRRTRRLITAGLATTALVGAVSLFALQFAEPSSSRPTPSATPTRTLDLATATRQVLAARWATEREATQRRDRRLEERVQARLLQTTQSLERNAFRGLAHAASLPRRERTAALQTLIRSHTHSAAAALARQQLTKK